MNKNEYRRAFIMLRPAQPGWSGHVRLERRTMTGSMYFIVSPGGTASPGGIASPTGAVPPAGEGGEVYAALAGQRAGEYFAALLGALKRDSRGQYTLAFAFDPRNIQGRPLEAYPLLAVARREGNSCVLGLTGNVDGAYPMDPEAVRQAVCALFAPDAPADDIPDADEAEQTPAPQAVLAQALAEAAEADAAIMSEALPEVPTEAAPSEPASTRAVEGASECPAEEPSVSDPAPAEATPVETIDSPPPDQSVESAGDPALEGGLNADPRGLDSAATRIYTRMRQPRPIAPGGAADRAADESPAPETASARETASTQAASTLQEASARQAAPARQAASALRWAVRGAEGRSAPCSPPLEDGYAYTRVPLPDACGAGWCLLGVRIQDGRLASVRAAFPGAYAAQPPAGLEGSVWMGAGGEGYWVSTHACGEAGA